LQTANKKNARIGLSTERHPVTLKSTKHKGRDGADSRMTAIVYTVIDHHDEILLNRIEIQENNSAARSNQQNDDHGDCLSALLDGNLLDFAAADCFADFEAAVVVGLDDVGAVVGSDDDVDAQENTSSSGISLQTVSLIQPNPSLTRA
jgi:hypothetical protein